MEPTDKNSTPEDSPQPELTPQDIKAAPIFDEIEKLQQLPESPENWDKIGLTPVFKTLSLNVFECFGTV